MKYSWFKAPLVPQLVKNPPVMPETPGSIPGSERSPGKGIGYPLQSSWASLVVQMVKESACNVGDLGPIPRWGRSPGGEHGNPLQHSCLENPIDRGAWWATVQRVGHAWLSTVHIWFTNAMLLSGNSKVTQLCIYTHTFILVSITGYKRLNVVLCALQ